MNSISSGKVKFLEAQAPEEEDYKKGRCLPKGQVTDFFQQDYVEKHAQ